MVSHLRLPRDGDRDTIDHVWPKASGGPDALGNLGLMAHTCNARKGDRLPRLREWDALLRVNAVLGWPTPEFNAPIPKGITCAMLSSD